MRAGLKDRLLERSVWVGWGFLVGIPLLWCVVGTAAYFVKAGYLPPDTAGWAQALGGFLAVVVAIGVPFFQARKAMALREAETREGRAGDSAAVYSLVCHFQGLMRRVRDEACNGYRHRRLRRDVTLVNELNDAVSMLREIPISTFSSEMVFYVLGLRKIGSFCVLAAEHFDELRGLSPLDVDDSLILKRAADELARLEEWLRQLELHEVNLRKSAV